MSYTIGLRYETDGSIIWNRRGLVIEGATQLTVWLTAATDMFEKDMEGVCCHRLEEAVQDGWEKVRAEHVKEHRAGMEQCSFTMPDTHADLPTEQRIRAFAENKGETTV